MDEPNPCAAPSSETAGAAKLPGAGVLFASVGAVALTTFGGCWVGVGGGYVAGSMAPGVYTSPEREYAAVPNAMAIGMGQGMGGGAVTGLLLVALFYWYRSRVRRRFGDDRSRADA